jgi:hypothetical protein
MLKIDDKSILLNEATKSFTKLNDLINSMSIETQEATFTFDYSKESGVNWSRDKNIRDVLTHLYEWHVLAINWIDNNKHANKVPFLPSGVNWGNYTKMNFAFYDKHQMTSLISAKEMLVNTHKQILSLIEEHSNEELFVNHPFGLDAKSNIADYMAHATISHYNWAIRKITKHFKTCCTCTSACANGYNPACTCTHPDCHCKK